MTHGVEDAVLSGVARPCPDCGDERLFVPVDHAGRDVGEYCCTWCAAALLIDPVLHEHRVSRDIDRRAG